MKTILIYILAYITISQVRAEVAPVKTFTCKSSYNMFNASFQQGDELFVDVYINESGKIDVKASQMYGPSFDVLINKEFYVGESRTTVSTTSIDGSYMSMVFLGSDNWGFYLKSVESDRPAFLPVDIELMCRQIDFSVI